MAQFIQTNTAKDAVIIAVSYTHLDVYKRQDQICLPWIGLETPVEGIGASGRYLSCQFLVAVVCIGHKCLF